MQTGICKHTRLLNQEGMSLAALAIHLARKLAVHADSGKFGLPGSNVHVCAALSKAAWLHFKPA